MDEGDQVSVAVGPEGPWMIVRVIDNGAGVPEEFRVRLPLHDDGSVEAAKT